LQNEQPNNLRVFWVLLAELLAFMAVCLTATLVTKNSSICLGLVGGMALGMLLARRGLRYVGKPLAIGLCVLFPVIVIVSFMISITRPHPNAAVGHVLDALALVLGAITLRSAYQIGKSEGNWP